MGLLAKGSQTDTCPTSFLDGKRITCALSAAGYFIRSDEF
jgi:hypothetical protein